MTAIGLGARLREAAKTWTGDRGEAERVAHAQAAVVEGIRAIDAASRATHAVLQAVEGQAIPGVDKMTAMVAALASDKSLPLATRRRLGKIRATGEALHLALEGLVGSRDAERLDVAPVAEVAPEVAAAPPAPVSAVPSALQGMRPLRVLAAEPNGVHQLMLKTVLAQVGIEPEFVADRAAVAEAWQREPWDLILLDIDDPDIDGATTARMIRSTEAQTGWGVTPIVALGAGPATQDPAASGIDGWVAKPILGQSLFVAIEAAVASPASPSARFAEVA